jgi:acetylornithine deacetylase/succinyl-diaminopimelate desuccinylase-like protein
VRRRARAATARLRALAAALLVAAPALLAAPGAAPARAADYDAAARSARRLLDALVAADTSNPPGNEARAAALGAERLAAAGIASERSEFAPGRENLVARLRGDGSQPPLLLLAHTDVVGAEGQAWTSDPHVVTERDGYLYGRGVEDDLGMAALALEVLVLLHEQKTPLARDVVLAWTGDEESGGGGIRDLIAQHPDSIQAAFALNEGGIIRLGEQGRPTWVELQTAEKTYQDYVLVAHGETGHSSVPLPDNAIYRLARALVRLADHRFPARLLPVTRAYLAARAPFEPPERARAMRALADAAGALPADALAALDADPVLSASLRTTCVATLLEAGTRVNALPAEARASVNCRILPDETPEQVHATLAQVLADPALEIRPTEEFGFGTPSPLDGPAPAAIAKVAGQMWPGLPVIPFMSRGATDSRFLRARGIPAYGLSPIPATDEDARRAHGIDERIPADGLRTGIEFLHRLVLELAASPGPQGTPPAGPSAQRD